MSRLISTHWISIDGLVSGPGGAMDWISPDAEMSAYEIDLVKSAHSLLLGRGTYVDFATHWPLVESDVSAPGDQRTFATALGRLKKIVASRSMSQAIWPETTFVSDLSPDAFRALKPRLGRAILYGSVSVLQALARHGLVDEFHLLVHPLALGEGTALFRDRLPLTQVHSRRFASGVILNVYRPAG